MSEIDDLKQETIDTIVGEIYQLQTIAESRRIQIQESIKTSINGDSPKQHLVINATLGKENEGILVYILTDVKLIKIEIGEQDGILSSTFVLSTFTGMTREFIENNNRISVNVGFGSNSIGLRYASSNQKITAFFQSVETLASSKLQNG
jgi:hypothetical protein